MTDNVSVGDYHQLEPCAIVTEPKGDRAHWLHQHEPIQVVHRLNPLLTDDHPDLQGRVEGGATPLGTVERLDAELIWCKECFGGESDG